MKRIVLFIMVLSTCLGLAACAPNLSPNTYYGDDVGQASTVKKGVVLSGRLVRIDNNSGVGGLAGATAGAVAGSTIGHGTSANVLGLVGGAIIGGVLGNEIDRSANAHNAVEYIIRLENGKTISVTQTMDMQFAPYQHVLVIFGPKTRIIPDNTPPSVRRRHAL